ncbi:GntR family transcriptional regulator [Jannaschia sp. CCS1]|uniref:GntR family transcriptional regulator n=1 Tax=Jannaschia sp. (strain CCS1) TaxID=290400 RepID=UPI000053B914|nr:GntR family transcriptional regulator [Jannaschia sp. CCS1]ABD54857.1 transcriptional regulator, GntR family [Jannaschia sp. CCS1]
MPETSDTDPNSGALPTYLRIAEALTIDIGGGRLSPGEKLPPERAMATERGVAVATLRKALHLLVERGLIERRQGSGNYVLGGGSNIGTYALFRLELKGIGGGLPTAKLLDIRKTKKPDDLPNIGGTFDVGIRMRRLRALADIPVAVEEIWLDLRWHDDNGLNARTVSESLYRTYADRLHLHIQHAEDVISAGPLPDWTPDELGLAPGTQVGFIERRAYDQHGLPCEASRTWFDPDRAQYFSKVP